MKSQQKRLSMQESIASKFAATLSNKRHSTSIQENIKEVRLQ